MLWLNLVRNSVSIRFSYHLSAILSNKIPDESTQSAVSPEATDAEITTEMNPDPSDLDNRPTTVSPKRPNDNSPNVKKKVFKRHGMAFYYRPCTLCLKCNIEWIYCIQSSQLSFSKRLNNMQSYDIFYSDPLEKKEEEEKENVRKRRGPCVFDL